MGRVWAHVGTLQRQYRRLRVLFLVLLLFGFGVLVIAPFSLHTLGLVLLGAGSVWLALELIRVRTSVVRLRKRLAETDDLLRLECGYDLTGVAAEEELGTCPECGVEIDVKEIRAGWAIARHRGF